MAYLDIPGYSAHLGERTIHRLAVVPAHEALNAEMMEDDSARAKLQEAIRDRTLPPSYLNHKVVLRWPSGIVLPISLYMDGTPYSKKD